MTQEKTYRNRIIELFRRLVWGLGFSVSRNTNIDEFKKFIRQIKPISVKQELIRVGSNSDGGYLMPDDLDNITECFSPGVDYNATFELDLSKNHDIKCFMADYSVDAPPELDKRFSFVKKYLGSDNDNIFMTLNEWVLENVDDKNNNLLLQMDIEGGEYSVLSHSSIKLLSKFRVMIIEFHKFDMLFNKDNFRFIKPLFDKILEEFFVVHIHPNNTNKIIKRGRFEIPPVIEFTFFRKDIADASEKALKFPNPLDALNHPNKKAVNVPKSWLDIWAKY